MTPELSSECFQEETFDEDLRQTFKVLKTQESTYKSGDYLSRIRQELSMKEKTVDKTCRFKMCMWCFEVAEYFNFNQETVSIAISYLDKYLSTSLGYYVLYDKQWFQLAVICSLNIAVKLNESKFIKTYDLIQLSNGKYTTEQIHLMEKEIINALSWRLCPPTSYVFVDFILSNLIPCSTPNNIKRLVIDMSRRQIHLAVPFYEFATFDPSFIAFAAIFNAIEELKAAPKDFDQKFNQNLKAITGFDHLEQMDSVFMSVRFGLRNLIDDHSSYDGRSKIIPTIERPEHGHFSIKSGSSPTSVRLYMS